MAHNEQSVRLGSWLFRWRSYLPLLFIAILIPAMRSFAYPDGSELYDQLWEVLCLGISFFGLSIRCYTIGYTPKGTSGRNTQKQIADTLNVTGIYSIVRNPLYLGNFFMMLGVISFLRTWWVDVIYALAFWVYYERIIWAEESFLSNKFGNDFKWYVEHTPTFVPKFTLWRPNTQSFSFRNVLKREYSGFFAVITSMSILEIVGDYIVDDRLVFDPMWAAIFIFGLAVYLTLRTLKKNTKILHVEGR